MQVTVESGTDWLVVVLAAVVAFAAAGFGSYVAGRITSRENRRMWLRQSCAAIYRGVLSELHNAVHDIVVVMQKTKEPQLTTDSLGRRYSDLYRDATAASREDGDRVERFHPEWLAIGELAAEWTAAKESKDRPEETTITRDYYARQVADWQAADDVLRDYNDWLKDQLA